MTVIAVKDNVMAADSMSSAGDIMYPAVLPKIVRVPQNGLIGVAGCVADGARLKQWALSGMDFDNTPKLRHGMDSEERLLWLWLKPNGELWRFDADFIGEPMTQGIAQGALYASVFAEGAMAAGASAEEAVRLSIGRCKHIGGDVQVERLAG